MTATLVVLVVAYAFTGWIVSKRGFFENHQSNPVQDAIHWMPMIVQIALWIPLLLTWKLSSLLNPLFWKGYISHEDQMEEVLNAWLREIGDQLSLGDLKYRTPSPREYREGGLSAFDLTITLN